jgi:hypothetical protein
MKTYQDIQAELAAALAADAGQPEITEAEIDEIANMFDAANLAKVEVETENFDWLIQSFNEV